MFILKIKYKIQKIFKKVFWKLIYRNKLNIGKNVNFRNSFIIMIDDEGSIKIGNNCFFNNNTSLNSLKEIVIGDNCIFGENVHIYDHNHRFDKNKEIAKQGFKKGRVQIGNNCWIGSNVTILKDVKIGNHVIIGANTLIKEDIEDNMLIQQVNNIKKEKIKIKNKNTREE